MVLHLGEFIDSGCRIDRERLDPEGLVHSRDDAGSASVGEVGPGPLKQNKGFVPESDQEDQMDKQPGEPCGVSFQLEAPHLGNGGGPAYRGHGSLVVVDKGWAVVGDLGAAFDLIPDDACNMACHLHGGRGNRWHGLSQSVLQGGDIPDSEDVAVLVQAAVRSHRNAAFGVQFDSEFGREWISPYSRAPEDRSCLNREVFENDLFLRNGLHRLILEDVHPQAAKLFFGFSG